MKTLNKFLFLFFALTQFAQATPFTDYDAPVRVDTSNGLITSGQTIEIQFASNMSNGALSSSDFNAFVAKQNSLGINFPPTFFLQFGTGSLTSVIANGIIGSGRAALGAINIVEITAQAAAFTCVSNPVFTLLDCGASVGACTSGTTTIGSVTLTAANVITSGTINTSAVTSNDYLAWKLTSGTCTVLNATGTAIGGMQ